MATETLELVYLPLSALARWAGNPKRHDLDAIRASITRYGMKDPPKLEPLLNSGGGGVVEGNGRVEVLAQMRERGETPPRGVRVEPGGEWLIPVLRGIDAASSTEAEAYGIDHNATVLPSLTPELLAELFDPAALAGLEALASGSSTIAVGAGDLEALLELVREPPGEAVEADLELADPREAGAKWGTAPGQVWRLGRHRLVCGDATDEAVARRAQQGLAPRLMATDPPYGVRYEPGWRNEVDGGGRTARIEIANDERADWRAAYRLFEGDIAYVWHAGLFAGEVAAGLVDAGFELRAQLIWAKPSLVLSRGHYHWQHEPCWYAVRKGRSATWQGDRKATTLWEIAGAAAAERVGHATQKPLECMARPMRHHLRPGEAVYEPFAGSGSTLIAAEQMGMICAAIELDPGWCGVILQRWVDLGGTPPEQEERDASDGSG